MKVIIMGCGKVGTLVSRRMEQKGHDVTVIDSDEGARERLRAILPRIAEHAYRLF